MSPVRSEGITLGRGGEEHDAADAVLEGAGIAGAVPFPALRYGAPPWPSILSVAPLDFWSRLAIGGYF